MKRMTEEKAEQMRQFISCLSQYIGIKLFLSILISCYRDINLYFGIGSGRGMTN